MVLIIETDENFYLPAFTGAIEGWMPNVKIIAEKEKPLADKLKK